MFISHFKKCINCVFFKCSSFLLPKPIFLDFTKILIFFFQFKHQSHIGLLHRPCLEKFPTRLKLVVCWSKFNHTQFKKQFIPTNNGDKNSCEMIAIQDDRKKILKILFVLKLAEKILYPWCLGIHYAKPFFQLFIHQKWQFYVDFKILRLLLLLILFQDLAKILHVLKKSLLKHDAKVKFCLNCYDYLCMIVSLRTWRASFKPHGMMVSARIYITYKALIIIFIPYSHI